MTVTVPEVGVVSPRMRSSRVVLPAPLVPRRAMISPGWTVKLAFFSACTGWLECGLKVLPTPVTSIAWVVCVVLMVFTLEIQHEAQRYFLSLLAHDFCHGAARTCDQ